MPDRIKSRPKQSPMARIRREQEINRAYSRLWREGAKLAEFTTALSDAVGWQHLSPRLPNYHVIFEAACKLHRRY